MKEWLEKKGVPFEEGKKYLKKDYWDLAKPLIEEITEIAKYRAEEIMAKYGVLCLRLPPWVFHTSWSMNAQKSSDEIFLFF